MLREIVIISSEDENIVVYETTLTDDELKKWANKASGMNVIDVIEEKQEKLQYYNIDGRLWMGKEKDEKIRNFIKE